MDDDLGSFDRERHVLFFQMMIETLPSNYEREEINRLTLAYFAISGLATLSALDLVDKDQIARWVLSFQKHKRMKADLDDGQFYGFHGSKTSQYLDDDTEVSSPNGSHLASTYCALAILKTIGCDFSSINSDLIVKSMKNLQRPDGRLLLYFDGEADFCSRELYQAFKAETDLRFVYCAATICFMLNNWTGMDKDKAKDYIFKCQSYDGGFGLGPGLESHGGATYCAVAALRLMGFIGADILSEPTQSVNINVPLLVEWCLQRQAVDGGFQGRTNKASDTCYAFWVGGVLKMLGAYHLVDKGTLRSFLISCQSLYGGFTKFPKEMLPDLYHSYYGLSALSLLEEPGITPLCVELGVTCLECVGN